MPEPKLYRVKYPHQPILLYKDFSEIIQDEDVVEGNTTVLFVWFPYLHAKLSLSKPDLTRARPVPTDYAISDAS